MEGYTFDLDSKEIIEYFEKLNTVELTGTLEAISMSSLEGRNNPDRMIAWLFEDLQSPDRKRLTQLMLERGLTRFLFEHIAYQIIQSKDEDEIVTMLSSYYGNHLDDILTRFEKKSGTGERQAVIALSGKLDQTPVYRLRRHFYQNGGKKARRYGALITAEKIMELLKGSTSSADRFSIVDNFLVTPSSLKTDVIGFVSEKTQQEWHKPAWLVLNEKLMPAHYNALRIMGLILPEYDRKKSNVSLLENTIDAFFTVTGVIIGAVIGVARGTLESFFELIIGLVDIAVLIKDFAMAALHYVTLGAVGRESHEKIVELFTGIVYAVNNPREVIKGVCDNLKVESDAIEGPHEYARRVYFWSKVVTKFTIGVVAIFGGIRALAAKLKTLKRGAKEVATVAEVAEEAAVTAERTRIPREPLPEPKKPVKGEKPPEPAKRPPGKGVEEPVIKDGPEPSREKPKSEIPAPIAKTRLTETINALSMVGADGNLLKYGKLAQKYQKYGDEIAAAVANLPEEKYKLAIKLIKQSKDPALTLQINHTIVREVIRDQWFLKESVLGLNLEKYPENLIPVINHVGSHPKYNALVRRRVTIVGEKYMAAFTEFKKTGKMAEEIRRAIRNDVLEELENLNRQLITEDGLLYPTGNYVVLGELKGKIPWK
ncbi:MAG: hypothetical protein F9K24_21875 [Leptonema illini]|uniref:Uncharacterized protein n=1 Tax=Leptonema illini TaxID=183 RepID=A0A833GY21_9LEPT|nr:MAG: hypothetical protein F9K24_21875 [Leptonema illini]